MLIGYRAVAKQHLLARSTFFYSYTMSSVAGGIVECARGGRGKAYSATRLMGDTPVLSVPSRRSYKEFSGSSFVGLRPFEYSLPLASLALILVRVGSKF